MLKIFQLLFISLLCLAVYLPSLNNGFVWDDDANLYQSLWIGKPEGLKVIWSFGKMYQYYPLTFSSFWLEHKLWGLQPVGYHATNLLLHILNAFLFFLVARKLYPRLAFPAALIFAVHPIQVETVAWITERKNLLSLFFFFLTLLAYLRFKRTKKTHDYALSLAAFACALLSKSVAVCFVLFPLLHEWWQEGRISLKGLKASSAFFCLGLFSALHALYLEFYRVGAYGLDFGLSFMERLLLSGRVAFFYIYKLVFPVDFIFFYPRWKINPLSPREWLLPLAVIVLLSALLLLRKKIGRGAAALFIFYLGSVFPVMGFFNVYGMRFSFVADHFAYISTPVLILFILSAAAFVFDRLRAMQFRSLQAFLRPLPAVLCISAAGYMCSESRSLAMNYKDEATLWNALLEKNPGSWAACNNLGTFFARSGKIDEAVALYKKAIRYGPDYGESYDNLGAAYVNTGRREEAIALYKSMELNPVFSSRPLLYYRLGSLYRDEKMETDAVLAYKKALALRPDYPEALNDLAAAYADSGRTGEAIKLWEEAVRMHPGFATAHFNLAVFYFRQKKYGLAVEHCDKVIASGAQVDSKFLELLRPYRR